MKKNRIIARLDVKSENVVKGVNFECLRVMGKPQDMVQEYFLQGADEIIYIDIVANLYGRENLTNIVDKTTEDVNIPMTVGGGVRTIEDIKKLLLAGADKVAINTAATRNPNLIKQSAEVFGSQCIVLSIEAKNVARDKWEAYTDNGRETTGLDVIEWAKKGEELGAGEILLTSVDMDGTENGCDFGLLKKVSNAVSVPVVVSGGIGNPQDVEKCIKECNADGVAIGTILHYQKFGIDEIKQYLQERNIPVRRIPDAKKVESKDHNDLMFNYNVFTLSHLKNKKENEDKETIKRKGIKDFDVGVIDYEINNVKSVVKAFEKIGKKVKAVKTKEEIEKSKILVLPGVGAFKIGMDALKKKNLTDIIIKKIKEGTPILGICLGMQLFFTESEEFGLHKGMNVIPGKVVSLKDPPEIKVENYRIPHMGWNELYKSNKTSWDKTYLKDLAENSPVYFVHSFYCKPANPKDCIATTKYGDQEFCVAVRKDNIMGTQFHPEKSGKIGLKILKGFCDLYNI